MGNIIKFVEQPIGCRMQGGICYFDIRTGDEVLQFAISASHFLAGFANAATVAREWRGGPGEVIPIKRATG